MLRKIMLLLIILVIGISGCTYITTNTTFGDFTLDIELNPGIDTVEVNGAFNDAGATAYLNDEPYDNVTIKENNLDMSSVGTYTIIYETSYGNETLEITRIVDVIDETPPVVTLNPGVDTIPLKGDWEDAGITAADNSGLDVNISVRGGVIDSQVGEYIITYTVTDASGNITIISRYVHVIDQR